jgi:hypothetical protein
MIIYNVTVKIDNEHHDDWLEWMQSTHIPDVMATGSFLSYRLSRVISMEDNDGTTYSIQYLCPDMKTLHQYQVHQAPDLQKEHTERYEGKFVAFRTLLEMVNHSEG